MKKPILAMTLALTLVCGSFLGFLPGKGVMTVEAAEAGVSTELPGDAAGAEGAVGASETAAEALRTPTVVYWMHVLGGKIAADGIIQKYDAITNYAIPAFEGEVGKQYEIEIWLNGETHKTVSGTASLAPYKLDTCCIGLNVGGVNGWRVESGEVVPAGGGSLTEEGIYQFRVREFSTGEDGAKVYSEWSVLSGKCDNRKESFLAYLESKQSGSDTADSSTDSSMDDGDGDDITNNNDTVTASSGEVLTSSAAINVTGTTSAIVRTPQSAVTAAAAAAVGGLKEGQYVMAAVGDSACGELARQAVTNAANSMRGKVVSYLEITLDICNPGGGVDRNVEQLAGSIEFTVAAPADIDGNQYDFAVVRLHGDGKVDILPDLDNDPATITFKTDRFSVYAVIYGAKGAFKTSGGKDRVPKTGDNTVPVLPFAAAGIVCAAAAVVMKRKAGAFS